MKNLIISISESVLLMLLFPVSLYAACPPSYQSIEELELTLISARWVKEDAEFALCTNRSNPELNNRVDSYGYRLGPANYRCGDIYLADTNLGSNQSMFVQPSDRSLRPVEFTENGSFWLNQDQKTRSWCETSGVNSQTCYSERKDYHRYFPRVNSTQELDTLYGSLSKKEKRLWDREGYSAVVTNLETQYTVQNISTCKKVSF